MEKAQYRDQDPSEASHEPPKNGGSPIDERRCEGASETTEKSDKRRWTQLSMVGGQHTDRKSERMAAQCNADGPKRGDPPPG